jgi:hypothetical protein
MLKIIVLSSLISTIAAAPWMLMSQSEIIADSTEFADQDTVYYDDEYYHEEYYDYDYYNEKDYSNMGELSFVSGFPLMQGRRKFNHSPTGFDLAYSKQISRSIPLFGISGITYTFYGSDSYHYLDYSPLSQYVIEVRESIMTNFFHLYFGGRFFSPQSFYRLNPYLQMDLRYRYLFGFINYVDVEFMESFDSRTKGGNGSFGYGITLGSLVNLGSDFVYLNIALTYDGGGSLWYFNKKKDIPYVFNVLDYYDQIYYPNSLLTLKIGILLN